MDSNWIKKNDTPKSVFNPLRTDFKCSYRDDNNQPREYIIRSMEIGNFPTYIANHIIKHLITAVQNERSASSTNQKATEDIRKEIEVSDEG